LVGCWMESMILDAGFAYRDVLRSVPDAMVAVSTVSVGNGWKPRREKQIKNKDQDSRWTWYYYYNMGILFHCHY
jgi:hypothetical protein